MQDMKLRNHGKTFDKGFKSFRSAEKFLATPEIFYWRKRYTLAHTPCLSLHKTCMWINTLSSDFINSLVKPLTNNISYKLQRRHHHPKHDDFRVCVCICILQLSIAPASFQMKRAHVGTTHIPRMCSSLMVSVFKQSAVVHIAQLTREIMWKMSIIIYFSFTVDYWAEFNDKPSIAIRRKGVAVCVRERWTEIWWAKTKTR